MLYVLIITGLAALGTLLGSLMAYFIVHSRAKLPKNVLNFIVALGGGLLLAAIALVLVPEGLKALSTSWAVSVFFAGSVVFMFLDILIEKMGERASQIMANTLDSLPESLGIGAAFATGGVFGPLLALLVGLQNIAEGFNSFDEMRQGGMKTKANFVLQILSSLAGPVGGIIGFLFLAGHNTLISGVFMFSAGGILYLIFHDIAPLAHREGHWVSTLGTTVGFIMGLISQALVS